MDISKRKKRKCSECDDWTMIETERSLTWECEECGHVITYSPN